MMKFGDLLGVKIQKIYNDCVGKSVVLCASNEKEIKWKRIDVDSKLNEREILTLHFGYLYMRLFINQINSKASKPRNYI